MLFVVIAAMQLLVHLMDFLFQPKRGSITACWVCIVCPGKKKQRGICLNLKILTWAIIVTALVAVNIHDTADKAT
jgi:hypothetical protein